MTEEQIALLQQALSEQDRRIAQLEQRLEDQEHSLRHVLAMLIEWMEGEGAQTPG